LFALLIIGSGAATIYYLFFMRMVRVPTGSMMNTIIPGDHLVIFKSFGRIERGRIIVFQYPNDSTYVIARVIGLPGETIQLRERTVYINERALPEQRVMAKEYEQYGPLQEVSSQGDGPYRVFYEARSVEEESSYFDGAEFATQTPFRIPEDSYFVMGDHRDNSEDSRYRGAVPRKLIWGEASIIYYSEKMPPDKRIRWERVMKRVQ
jgi:signal peptidase I